jgi:RNA-directed DNA polymerase
MSLDNASPGASRAAAVTSEGRRLPGQQPSAQEASGGVSVDSMSGSAHREGWELCDREATQPSGQAGATGKTEAAVAEVGVLHSIVDLWVLDADSRAQLRQSVGREGTCSDAWKRSKGQGDGPPGIQTPQKVRKLQIALYRKAKADRKWRFWSLYGELYRRDILEHALQLVARNGGAPGVDGQSIGAIMATPARRQSWLDELQRELQTKTYRPSPVRRVYIPKSNGGQRPLGIPTVKDRVAQMAAYLVLMPIFEADFHPHSFGFRPKRNAHQALDTIVQALRSGRTEVLDADLSKYFDTIPHRPLLRACARRISDGSVLRLIKQWLRAPVVEEDQNGSRRVLPNRAGTPQGGVLSPLLANLYLNPLDWAVNERCAGKPVLVRYADDFVILSKPGAGQLLRQRLSRWLGAKGLSLNESKTRIVNFHQEDFHFLGFKLSWRRGRSGRHYPHVEPGVKSQQQLRANIRAELNHWTHWRGVQPVVQRINQILRGWSGYYHYRNSSRVFGKTKWWVETRMKRWLWRKHGCARALWEAYPTEKLYAFYGLWPLSVQAGWTARAGPEAMRPNRPGEPDTANPYVRFDEGRSGNTRH